MHPADPWTSFSHNRDLSALEKELTTLESESATDLKLKIMWLEKDVMIRYSYNLGTKVEVNNLGDVVIDTNVFLSEDETVCYQVSFH